MKLIERAHGVNDVALRLGEVFDRRAVTAGTAQQRLREVHAKEIDGLPPHHVQATAGVIGEQVVGQRHAQISTRHEGLADGEIGSQPAGKPAFAIAINRCRDRRVQKTRSKLVPRPGKRKRGQIKPLFFPLILPAGLHRQVQGRFQVQGPAVGRRSVFHQLRRQHQLGVPLRIPGVDGEIVGPAEDAVLEHLNHLVDLAIRRFAIMIGRTPGQKQTCRAQHQQGRTPARHGNRGFPRATCKPHRLVPGPQTPTGEKKLQTSCRHRCAPVRSRRPGSTGAA